MTRENESGQVADTILVTVPTAGSFRGIPSLVLGGVGSRLDLPYERMDDLQLAVLSLLDASAGDEASVEIRAEDGGVSVSVGPLRADAPTDNGLALVLRRLADDVSAESRDGAAWLTVYLERAGTANAGVPESS